MWASYLETHPPPPPEATNFSKKSLFKLDFGRRLFFGPQCSYGALLPSKSTVLATSHNLLKIFLSEQNHSDRKHWVIIPCYNRMDNNPYFDHHHARATKLFKVPEVESRTQGSRPRPRPRTQKKSEAKAKAKDSLSEDRHSRGQGQECSRPRPRTKDTKRKCSPKKKKKNVFTKIFQAISKKKRSSQKFFKRSPRKNAFQKIFQALHKILTFQKIVLSSSRGQANFRGLEASRPRPRPRT